MEAVEIPKVDANADISQIEAKTQAVQWINLLNNMSLSFIFIAASGASLGLIAYWRRGKNTNFKDYESL